MAAPQGVHLEKGVFGKNQLQQIMNKIPQRDGEYMESSRDEYLIQSYASYV